MDCNILLKDNFVDCRETAAYANVILKRGVC